MGFPSIFTDLIYECISTPSLSALVDGSPFDYIESSRGLRQGDPLSPYLFSIAMEFLSISLDVEYIKGNITPIYNIEPMITHLLYADDILILTKATTENSKSIQQVFQMLNELTGLNLNENKPTLHF